MSEAKVPVSEAKVPDNQLKLSIPDVYVVAQGIDLAIKRKVFTEDEITKLYVPWSNVMRFCEDIKRKTEVEELYRKVREETTDETVPDLIDETA